MKCRRGWLALCALVLAGWLAGCTTPPQLGGTQPVWSGRLALQVEGQPQQSFTAGFELRGSAREGALTLLTPLGSSAGHLQWSPTGATWRSGGATTQNASTVDQLLTQALGSPVPLTALFDWLAGIPTPAAGWQADLSQRETGRLQARRLTAPAATLRVILDTP